MLQNAECRRDRTTDYPYPIYPLYINTEERTQLFAAISKPDTTTFLPVAESHIRVTPVSTTHIRRVHDNTLYSLQLFTVYLLTLCA